MSETALDTSNPGTLNGFIEGYPEELSRRELITLYSKALDAFRRSVVLPTPPPLRGVLDYLPQETFAN